MNRGVNRIRDEKYLWTIRGQPCLICGQEGEAHHLTHAQPRAMGRKTGDQYCVPLCHAHHMQLHDAPMSERMWWVLEGIDPIQWAEDNYDRYDNG